MRFSNLFGFLAASILCLSGCVGVGKKANGTYLGGEIVNPRSNILTIIKNDVVIDTVQLDANNRFLYEFDNFESGLYNFVHAEGQVLHLEEGDSLMLRLNTVEFDESLSYTGIGAKKNNFLMDLFLQKEKEDGKLNDLYQRLPKNFELALDSIYEIRKAMYANFKSKNTVSIEFDKMMDLALRVHNYQRKEQYPFTHYSRNKIGFIKNLPDDFYSFRESIDMNDPSMEEFYGYIAYLENYFNHQSFLQYGENLPYNIFSYHHNIIEIKLIDSLISNPDIKDHLLRRLALVFIANNNEMGHTDEIYDAFDKSTHKSSTKKRIERVFMANKRMQAGHVIPDQLLVDAEGRLVTLHDVIEKPTVLYFWSMDALANSFDHMENAHRRSQELRSKFPEFDFVGIHINVANDLNKWQKAVKNHKYHIDREFQFKDYRKSLRDLVVLNHQSKTLLLYPDGKIYNSHSNLYQVGFEDELLAFLNQ